MKKVLLLLGATIALGACATPATHTGSALFIQSKQPVLATDVAANGSKVGTACATNLLGLYISGDSSIAAAKKNGRITQVTSVDEEITSYAVWSKVCTVVTGR